MGTVVPFDQFRLDLRRRPRSGSAETEQLERGRVVLFTGVRIERHDAEPYAAAFPDTPAKPALRPYRIEPTELL